MTAHDFEGTRVDEISDNIFRISTSVPSIVGGGITFNQAPESGDKLTRFGPFSSQCRAGNVKIPRRAWNEELFHVLEGFRDLAHDDEVDACSGALEMLNPRMRGWAYYELMRQQAQELKRQGEPEPRETHWPPGSVEWQAEQESKKA